MLARDYGRDTWAPSSFSWHTPSWHSPRTSRPAGRRDLTAFTRSTRRLADEIQGQVEVVYPAHVLRYAAPPEFITQTADGFARISDGSAQSRPGTDIFGSQVREFWFGTFAITLPASLATDI
jgi:hypothetical protein